MRTILNPRYRNGFSDKEQTQPLIEIPFDYYIQVPCGRCRLCRKSRGRDWRIRLHHEALYGNIHRMEFITLTFAPKYYERFKDSPQDALRLFLERYRKRYGKSLRHFFVTELGEQKGRLHLHGIVFNSRFRHALTQKNGIKRYNKELRSLWKYGNTWVDHVRDTTINYVVKYILKFPEYDPKYVAKVFVTPGLGRAWSEIPRIQAFYWNCSDDYYTVKLGMSTYPLPRYYILRFFSDDYRRQLSYLRFVSDSPPPVRMVDGIQFSSEDTYNRYLYNEYWKDVDAGYLDPLRDYFIAPPVHELMLDSLSRDDDYSRRVVSMIYKFNPKIRNYYGSITPN